MPNVVDRPEESCESLGIAPTTVGLVGAIGADVVSKMLIGGETRLEGRLLTVDTAGLEFVVSLVSKRPSCTTCADSNSGAENGSEALIELCGGKSFNVLPDEPLSLDLQRLSRSMPSDRVLAVTETVLVYRTGELVVSLFRTGRLLVEGVQRRENALLVARNVWQQASKEPAQTS